MSERCKLNPCCGEHYGNCKPPVQYDGSHWDDANKRWIKPGEKPELEKRPVA